MSNHHLIAASALGLLMLAEAAAPFFVEQRQSFTRLARHDLRNLLLGLANAAVTALLFAGLLAAVDSAAASRGFGLTRWLGLTGWPAWIVAMLAFDCWMYWWHRINHIVPFLWRFHRAHHSDTAMDASSGLRFHPGEIALSGVARLAIVPLLGMSIEQLATYGAVSLPIVLFHHANIRLPRWLDFGLFQSGLLVTPAMHRVHHSVERDETNSNYSSVLAIWDRLFGSLRVRADVEAIRFGLEEFRGDESQSLAGVLATPFVGDPSAQEKTGEP